MDELKECPLCGSDKVSFHEDEDQYDELASITGFIWCHECDFSSDSFYSKKIAAEKWDRRAMPENKPLTLDELRGMDGEPVYCLSLYAKAGEWAICRITEMKNSWFVALGGATRGYGDRDNYGTAWLAYRAKPDAVKKEGNHNGKS